MWHLYALRLIFLKDIGKHKTMYLGFSFPLSGEWEKFGGKNGLRIIYLYAAPEIQKRTGQIWNFMKREPKSKQWVLRKLSLAIKFEQIWIIISTLKWDLHSFFFIIRTKFIRTFKLELSNITKNICKLSWFFL